MKEAKKVSSLLSGLFKLSKKCYPTSSENKKKMESISYNWEFNVCHGMHKIRYSSNSWSCE